MTNEEIIENTHTGFFTIVEAMDAARKDEALNVLNWLSDGKSKFAVLYGDNKRFCTDTEDLTTEQLYELFKKEK